MNIIKTSDYKDEQGQVLYQSCRTDPKGFFSRRPDGAGGWVNGLNGTRKVLYKLPELIESSKQDFIFVCEGEKDTDRLCDLGFPSTTNVGGALNWDKSYNKFFEGRLVALLPDNDEPGRNRVNKIASELHGIASEIRIVELPGLPDHGDISDWLDAGHTAQEFQKIVDATRPYEPAKSIFPLTDTGNAERFAAMNGDKLRYCVESSRWFFWDGCRWDGQSGNEKAAQAAILTVRSIVKDADDVLSKADREKIISWSLSCESQHRLNAMLALSKNLNPIVCHFKDFDRDDYSLNCLNGTIDLKTGIIRDHDPADMITKLCPVKYDPYAQSDSWEVFLDISTEKNKELQDFLQTSIGYALTGDTKEEKMFFIHGPTATGKSSFLEAIKSVFGDYAMTTDFETFIQRKQVGGVRNDIARLAGTRFVLSIEVDEGKELAEGLIKILTGGDTVSARFLYQESFEFVPRCKLWLAANHAPRVSDRDDAIWRRILRVPFIHTVPEGERDPAIKATLRDTAISGPAILAWAVKGCLRWQKDGLKVPDIIRECTEEYRTENDPLKDFFETECQFSPEMFTTVFSMRQHYEAWARNTGIKYTLGPKAFNERLSDKGCEQRTKEVKNDVGTIKPQRCWLGVGLTGEQPC
jgi:putative DNA primase/helicase